MGCQRGSFKSKILPIHLCPKTTNYIAPFSEDSDPLFDLPQYELPESIPLHVSSFPGDTAALLRLIRNDPNVCLANEINRRNEYLVRLSQDAVSNPEKYPLLQHVEMRSLFQDCSPDSKYHVSEPSRVVSLIPLKDCVLDIAWELAELSNSSSSDAIEFKADELSALSRLLPAAARYQAKYEMEPDSVS